MVKRFQKHGHVVAAAGQGFEDAVVLATADVSLAPAQADEHGRYSEWTFLTSFICPNDQSALACVVDVLRHGTACQSSLRALLFFGFVMIITLVICTGFVQALAPQYGIHESRLVAFRFIVLYIVVFAVALVCYVTRKDDKLSMLSSKVFTAKSIGWMICQISFALFGLVLIFIFAWGKELSLPTQMLKYQSSETLFAEKFGYPYFYETAEAGMLLIWSLWILSTLAVSTKIAFMEKLTHARSLQFLILCTVVVLFKFGLMTIVWGAPSSWTCWFGLNCDNNASYQNFNRCLFASQLPTMQQKFENRFIVPQPSSQCQFLNGLPQAFEGQVSDSDFLQSLDENHLWTMPFFSRNVCQARHNCIGNDTRLHSTIILSALTVISIFFSFALNSIRKSHK